MKQSARTFLSAAIAVAACGALLLIRPPAQETAAADAQTLAASAELTWYRGNIHTHSIWSDGDDFPEMIAQWYKDRGYDFLCFTEHNVLQNSQRWVSADEDKTRTLAVSKLMARFPDWVNERTREGKSEIRLRRFEEMVAKLSEPGKFLLVRGEEITDRFQKRPVHLNVTNIKDLIPPMGGDSVYQMMQNNIDAAVAQRERTGQPMIVHLNHPNFRYAITADDLLRVRGEKFFEVYNGHPEVYNAGNEQHASTDRIWDIVLTHRLALLGLPVMYGLGTDDGHEYHNIPSRTSEPGRGWIYVLANSLTPEDLINAMEAGRFYASSGVTLEKVVSSSEGLAVTMKPDKDASYIIEFIGTRRDFDRKSEPVKDKDGNEVYATRRYSDDIGEVFATVEGTQGSYQFTGDEIYVRARITSSRKHPNPSEPGEYERAWVQPVVGPGAP